jgi:pimeloyl-ACP methyl ester carboxylesterase
VSEESRKIDLGTHALRIREAGAGATTIVCLHGFLEGTGTWDAIVPGLSGLGKVVRVQQRGHGDSTAPEGACSLDDLATDVVQLLDALEIARAVLVGHGLGGLVALEVARRAPERVVSLVSIAGFSELDERAAAEWRHIVRAGEVNKLQGLARSVFGPTSRESVDGDGIALTEIARALQQLGSRTGALAAIRCPTVVIAGERDGAGTSAARVLAAHVPGARLELVAAAGAAPHVDAPEQVVQAIRTLLAALAPG